jgi:hypothetical protein
LQQKQGSSDSAALKYAAKQLAQQTTSGSGQLYAQNLNQAANQLQGKPMDTRGALELLQTLIGGGQAGQSSAQQGGGDALGAILGSLSGGSGAPSQQPAQNTGDLMGSLLGGLTGGEATNQPSSQSGGGLLGSLLGGLTGSGSSSSTGQSGFGMDDIMNAGMAYFQAKQQGGSNSNALVQAFMAGSGMGGASHRQESTQLVVNSFLQGLGSMMGKQ